MRRLALILTFLSLLDFSANARLSLRQPTSDHMVLQQQSSASIWGYATPGSVISAKPSWGSASYTAKTGSNGQWTIEVETPKASYTPHSITVRGDGGSITISDVLVGEVWLASGQSNMEMPIRGFSNCPVEGYNEIITQAPAENRIRMFYVYAEQTDEPLVEVRNSTLWKGANPDNIPEMSATAYFFARKLNQVLDVPVGIVEFARGGSRVESWLPKSTIVSWGEDVSPEAVQARESYTRAFQMYNAMEVPLQGYTARGFIWYQGCSNVGHADEFVPRMTELVRQFRSDWKDSDNRMPFYQVEIAPYQYNADGPDESAPLLRYAQKESAKVIPNSAIISTNDLVRDYEASNIHPALKEPVGNRLAYLALHRDYGFSRVACYSPEATGAYISKDNPSRLVVELSGASNGMDRQSGIKALFAVDSKGVSTPIESAVSFDLNGGVCLMNIDISGIDNISEIRYGWDDFAPGNLHNLEGLPVFPFKLKVSH